MSKLILSFVGLGLVLSIIARNAWGVAQYTVTDLGKLPGGVVGGVAEDINNEGQVVGFANMPNGNHHAFIYSNGTMTDLGTLGGSNSVAYGINSHGQVVGEATTSTGDFHAFLYSDGMMTDLGTLPGGFGSTGYAINSIGQVVGTSNENSVSGLYHAFLYSDRTMTDLGTLPGGWKSYAQDINDNGQIVGRSNTSSDYYNGFLYSDGTMTDLGLGEATAINSSGQVVGYNKDGVIKRAFLYANGHKTYLGTIGTSDSFAYDINNIGQVVGSGTTSSGYHAFLYTSGTIMDLNSLIDSGCGLTLNHATAINDAGQIAGSATDAHGTMHAFLLIPIPEPSTLVLLSINIVGLLAYNWRGRKSNS
jgi:probable HAF family extracellular repeat protein